MAAGRRGGGSGGGRCMHRKAADTHSSLRHHRLTPRSQVSTGRATERRRRSTPRALCLRMAGSVFICGFMWRNMHAAAAPLPP